MMWRVIVTDSEGPTGIAPVCPDQDDPKRGHASPFDGEPSAADWVFDCCPQPHIECHSATVAAEVVRMLNDANAEPCP